MARCLIILTDDERDNNVDIHVEFDPKIEKVNGAFRPTRAQALARDVFEKLLTQAESAWEKV